MESYATDERGVLVPAHDVTDELERAVATDLSATVDERQRMLEALRRMRHGVQENAPCPRH